VDGRNKKRKRIKATFSIDTIGKFAKSMVGAVAL